MADGESGKMNNAPVGCDGFFVDAVGPPDMQELFANAKCSSRYGPRRSNTSEAYSYRNMYCLVGSLLVDAAFNTVVVEEMDAMLLRVFCRDADVAKATIAARVKKEGNMEYEPDQTYMELCGDNLYNCSYD